MRREKKRSRDNVGCGGDAVAVSKDVAPPKAAQHGTELEDAAALKSACNQKQVLKSPLLAQLLSAGTSKSGSVADGGGGGGVALPTTIAERARDPPCHS